jgi:hypothetical protein
MKFVKSTLNYIVKNPLYLLILGIVPAVFYGIVLNPFKTVEFINNYSQAPVLNFGSIFYGMVDFGLLQLVLTLVTIILMAIFISAILGQIEHHFRSGKFNLEAIKDHVNNNILVALANLVAFLVVGLVIAFASSAILFLTHLLISGINSSPTVFNVVISNVILSVMLIVYALISSVLFINTVNMMTDGSQFRYSFSTAIKLTQKNSFALTVAVIAPYLIVAVFISLFINSGFLTIINILGVLLLIIYYSTLAMTAYYDLSKTERYDNRKKYYHR